jgi:ribonuclease HI
MQHGSLPPSPNTPAPTLATAEQANVARSAATSAATTTTNTTTNSTSALQWRAWYDGSALPNPGKIGLGAIVEAPDGRLWRHSAAASRSGCNNEAELHALCAVLDLAFDAGARHLLATGDSDFVVQHLQGPASTKIERLNTLLAEARGRIARFDSVELRWVPRHRNQEANLLARQALGLTA